MSHPEIRVQYDAINAVIAAAQEILIKSAQPVAHEGHGRYSGVLTQAAPKGPLFRSSSLRKSVDSYPGDHRQNDSEIANRAIKRRRERRRCVRWLCRRGDRRLRGGCWVGVGDRGDGGEAGQIDRFALLGGEF